MSLHHILGQLILYISGIGALSYLLLKRQPLSWSQTKYGIWIGVRHCFTGTFLVIVVPILRKYLDPKDTTLLIPGLISAALGEMVLSVGISDWIVFLCKLQLHHLQLWLVKGCLH